MWKTLRRLLAEQLDTMTPEQQLDNDAEELRQTRKIGEDMEYVEDGGFYIRKSEQAEGKNISYCPLCWTAAKGRVIALDAGASEGHYVCWIHNSHYQTSAPGRGHKARGYE